MMSNFLFPLWSYRVARISLGMVFVIFGLPKLFDPGAFAKALSLYDVIPEQFLPFVAIGLPLIEVLAGLGLVLDIKGSLTIIGGLLVLFITVLIYGVINDLNIDCGCLMPWEKENIPNLKTALYRDLIMFAIVIYVYLWRLSSPYKNNVKLKAIRRRS